MNEPAQRQSEMLAQFKAITSWEDRYRKIIDLGKAMPQLDDQYKCDNYKVKGCQSQVWMQASLDDKGRVIFRADSDALIVRGLVGLLVQFYSELMPKEILDLEPSFIRELGFESNLTPSRANGLLAMVKQMKYYALAFNSAATSSSS